MSKTQILETIPDKRCCEKLDFFCTKHHSFTIFFLLSVKRQLILQTISYTWAPPSPPPGSMLVLCPSAYGLTAVTKFGRDNIVIGGRGERERGREGGSEGTKIEESLYIYHFSTVIDFSSEKYSGSTGHRNSWYQ